jgi:hypothetical protein
VLSVSASMTVALVLAASPVNVRSATNCPSTEDIVERLLPLLPAAASGSAEEQDVAQVDVGEVQAGGAMELHLLLVRADASVVGARRLLMQGTCQDMAEAVATVIAAWETKPLPGAVPDVASAPAVKQAAAPLQVRATGAAPPPTRAWQILVGVGAGVALVGGVAAAGGFDIQFGRATSRWQLRLGLAGQTYRQLDLSPGQVDWRHTTAALGVGWRVLDPAWLFSLDAGPVAGWATLAGRGFDVANRTQRSFEYGVEAGVRAGRILGRFTLWVEWRTNLWAGVKRATLTGAASAAELPRVDTTVGLGLSVALFR